jgi:PST family polysaccharide transporter
VSPAPAGDAAEGAALAERVRGGARWVAAAHAGRHALHALTLLVLARWLPPDVFGLASLILVVATFVLVVADAGFGAALVQRPALRDEELHTAFWASLASGAGAAGAAALAAAPVAAFFGEPGLCAPLRAYAASFLWLGVAQVPQALLQRGLDFRRLAAVETAGQLVFAALAVALAARGAGVWSLVWGRLAADALAALGALAASGYRPRLRFSAAAARSLLPFGASVVGLRVLNHLAAHLDRLLVGKLAGSAALGLYAMAWSVVRLPEQHVSQAVRRLFFPALSRMQGDRARLASAYERLVGAVALLAFPATAGIVVLYPDLVALFLPAAWEPTIPLVRILAVAGALFAVGGTIGVASWSLGRPDVDLRLAALRLGLMLPLLALFARAGAAGVAAAVAVYAVATLPVYLRVVHGLLGIPPLRLLGRLRPACVASLATAAAALPARAAMEPLGLGPAGSLVAGAVAGAAGCVLALWVPRDRLLLEILAAWRGRGAGAPSAGPA